MSEKLQIDARNDMTLHVYALGTIDFDAFLSFQRRLQYEISEERRYAALILCEHPSLITVGRRGSRSHIRLELAELQLRGWPIRWINRGGGCILHGPGQLAICPILPLDVLGIGIPAYLQTLNAAVRDLIGDFSIHQTVQTSDAGVRIGLRLAAALGVTVRDWITGYGAYLNVCPPLGHYHDVATDADAGQPMTSLERERHGAVRPALVRERLLEHFQARFGFARSVFFTDHPALAGWLTGDTSKPKVLT